MKASITNKMLQARIAGLFYLLFILMSVVADQFAAFAMSETPQIFSRIVDNESLFMFGLVTNMLAGLFFLIAAWGLYALLKSVNQNMSLLFLLLNLVGVGIQCVAVFSLFNSVELLSGAEYLGMFSSEQLEAQALLSIEAYQNIFLAAQLFFGAWLFPLGYTIYKSGFIPKLLGALLIADFFAVTLWFLNYFLFSSIEAVTMICALVSALAEFSITGWLLIKGINITTEAKGNNSK